MVDNISIARAETKHFLADGVEYALTMLYTSLSSLIIKKSDQLKPLALEIAACADASHSKYASSPDAPQLKFADALELIAVRALMVAAYQQPYNKAIETIRETQAVAQRQKFLRELVDAHLSLLEEVQPWSYTALPASAVPGVMCYQGVHLAHSLRFFENVTNEARSRFDLGSASALIPELRNESSVPNVLTRSLLGKKILSQEL